MAGQGADCGQADQQPARGSLTRTTVTPPGSSARMASVSKDGTPPTRSRMAAGERREQLITIARGVFAERGYDGAAIEEVAARAGVSKPVVYEHFGGKEGLYAVVVDRDVTLLLAMMREALTE